MKESTWRKIDKIYMIKRRRQLARRYRGDPADAENFERILREEILPPGDAQDEYAPPRFPWLAKLRKRTNK